MSLTKPKLSLTTSRWKGAVALKIKRLEDTIAKIASKIDLSDLDIQVRPEEPDSIGPPVDEMSNGENIASLEPQSREEEQPKQTWEVIMDPRGGPASIPASCVSENIRAALPNSLPTSRRPDLISTGIITLRQALALFDTYHLRLDHFLYRILGDHISLDSVRIASPLLTAAVCTVGALHSPSLGHLFDICYAEYKDLVTSQVFFKNANADDIRGLCIGAFWLHELSWALIGNGKPVKVSSGRTNTD